MSLALNGELNYGGPMIERLRTVSLFNNLSHDHMQSISELCKIKTYKAGTILFREHEMGMIFYIVITGSVKIYTSNRNGDEEKIFAVFTSGDAFGELSLLDGKPRSATAQALEDTQVLSLAAQEFTNLLKDNFDITLTIMKELCGRLRETNQQVHDLTFLDAKERVMKNLVKLATKHGSRNGNLITIQTKLNVNEISQMVGVPISLLFQVFKDLQDKQILNLSDNQFSLNVANIRK
jgi:CRP/FNR family cyclic AMP-dependent transcriptional regulator